jgi:hypothetical protein
MTRIAAEPGVLGSQSGEEVFLAIKRIANVGNLG